MHSSPKSKQERRSAHIEKRLYQVLLAFAESRDMSLNELLESIVLHALTSDVLFSPKELLQIEQIKRIYNVHDDYRADRES